MRRAARIDRNQPEIVDALRRLGASVQPLHTVGHGCPDLLVGWRGKNILLEVKDGARPPSEQKLSAVEAEWHAKWKGQVMIVRSAADLLELLV